MMNITPPPPRCIADDGFSENPSGSERENPSASGTQDCTFLLCVQPHAHTCTRSPPARPIPLHCTSTTALAQHPKSSQTHTQPPERRTIRLTNTPKTSAAQQAEIFCSPKLPPRWKGTTTSLTHTSARRRARALPSHAVTRRAREREGCRLHRCKCGVCEGARAREREH